MKWQEKVINWSRNESLEGFDPYDLLSMNEFTRSLMSPFRELPFHKKIAFLVLAKSNDWFPNTVRKILKVPKKVHPTYLGLLLHAELLLKDKRRSEKRIQMLREELLAIRIQKYSNYCWGTPFSWRSNVVEYPEGTPFTVVTAWIGEAFLELYKEYSTPENLEICESIASFFIEDLQLLHLENDTICFSYSPLTTNDINNSNLMVAAYLAKLDRLTNKNAYTDFVIRATRFSVNTQLENGLIPYYGNKECRYNDSYHSSYELKSILDIIQYTGVREFDACFNRYLDYYLSNYFQPDFSITKYPNKRYPVDGTAIADGYILLSKLSGNKKYKELGEHLNRLDELIENEWIKSDGSIRYKKLSKCRFSSITYTRWIMGWFVLAAAESYIDNE